MVVVESPGVNALGNGIVKLMSNKEVWLVITWKLRLYNT